MENRFTYIRPPVGMQWPFSVSTADFQVQAPVAPSAATADLFAVAWTLAQRDYELDRLFNAEFYYEI